MDAGLLFFKDKEFYQELIEFIKTNGIRQQKYFIGLVGAKHYWVEKIPNTSKISYDILYFKIICLGNQCIYNNCFAKAR